MLAQGSGPYFRSSVLGGKSDYLNGKYALSKQLASPLPETREWDQFYSVTRLFLLPFLPFCALFRETFFLSLQFPLPCLSKPARLGASLLHSGSLISLPSIKAAELATPSPASCLLGATRSQPTVVPPAASTDPPGLLVRVFHGHTIDK